MLVEVPDEVGRLLDAHADRMGLPLPEVLALELQAIARYHRNRDEPRSNPVGHLVDAGWCDADIAGLLHYAPGYVAEVRRRLGKPANRRPR